MSKIGGKSCKKISMAILKRIIHCTLANKYSWNGGKGKMQFNFLTGLVNAVICNIYFFIMPTLCFSKHVFCILVHFFNPYLLSFPIKDILIILYFFIFYIKEIFFCKAQLSSLYFYICRCN